MRKLTRWRFFAHTQLHMLSKSCGTVHRLDRQLNRCKRTCEKCQAMLLVHNGDIERYTDMGCSTLLLETSAK